MMERKIMHADINHCYAQIMEMLYPQLRDIPMAVGGNEEMRHGIILARNLKAKAYGVKTAETLREALKKCPQLVIVPPQFQNFMIYTEQVKDIYREYTDQVESFGLDEAWVDLTHSQQLFGDALDIAKTIQQRVLNEVGLTISIGLSFNKVFAKLGSDMIKPMGFVEIRQDNYQSVIHQLPVEDLLYVGPSTKTKLNHVDIFTIGDLANKPKSFLKHLMGKNGEMIWYFANGLDTSEVMLKQYKAPIKSVGNSITTPADITSYAEALIVFQVLAESVASRLRDAGMQGRVISISLRDVELSSFTRQRKRAQPTNLSSEIMSEVKSLLQENYVFSQSLRSIGISVSDLCEDSGFYQYNLFEDSSQRDKQVKLEQCIDEIRNKYGFNKVQRLSVHINRQLTDFNPKSDHVIFPASWF